MADEFDMDRAGRALIAAHEAGDEKSARLIATEMRSRMKSSPEPVSERSDASQGLEATGRTVATMLGTIPQGLRAVGDIAFGGKVEGAMDRASSSNFGNMLPTPNPKVADMQNLLGEAMMKPIEAAGHMTSGQMSPSMQAQREASLGGTAFGRANPSAVGPQNSNPQVENLSRTLGEAAANFIPFEKAIPRLKGAKVEPTVMPRLDPNSVAGRLKALEQQTNKSADNNKNLYEYEALRKTLEARNTPINLPDRMNPEAPTLPKSDIPTLGPEDTLRQIDEVQPQKGLPNLPESPEDIQARIQSSMDEMNGLPKRSPDEPVRPGETPLPEIHDPDALPRPELSLAEKESLDKTNVSPAEEIPSAGAPRMPIETLQHNMIVDKMQRMVEERSGLQDKLDFLRKVATDENAYNHAASQTSVPTKQSLPPMIAELRKKIDDLTEQMTQYTTDKGIPTKEAALGARDIYQTTQPTEGANKIQKTTTYPVGTKLPALGGGRFQKGVTLPLGESPVLKALNRLFKSKKEPAASIEVNKGEQAAKAVQNIPGLKDTPWTPVPKDAKELKNYVMQGKDIGNNILDKFRNNFASGMKGIVALTNHPVLKLVSQVTDAASARASIIERELLVDTLKPAFSKLSGKEIQDVWSAIKTGMGDRVYTPEELKASGLNDKGVQAYQTFHKVMDDVHTLINSELTRQGKKPISKYEAYAASKWHGDYRGYVHDKDGKLLYVIAENNHWAAKRALKYIQDHGKDLNLADGLKIGYEPPGTKNPTDFAQLGYLEMLKTLDKDDPRVKQLQSIKDDYDAQKGFDSTGFKNHLKIKSGVGGASGFKPWETDKVNSREGLNSQVHYIEQAARWSEYQKALDQVKETLNDPEVIAKHPNAVELAKDKVRDMLGYGENKIGGSIDTIIHTLSGYMGVSSKSFANLRDGLKGIMYTKFFGLNPAFWSIQALQALFAVPQLMKNGSIAHWAPALADSTKLLADMARGTLPEDSKFALKYAQEHDVYKDAFMSDIRDMSKPKALRAIDKVSNLGARQIEQATRLATYLNFYHMFKRSGEASEKSAAMATQLTFHTMVDYRSHEAPRFYQNLGMIGKMASSLKLFTHNQYTQLAEMAKFAGTEMRAGRVQGMAPLMALVGLQMGLAGSLGFYGVDEADKFVHLLKDHGLWHGDTPKEYMVKNWSNLVNFGGVSKVTGVDMSSRLSAGNPVPDSLVDTFAPMLSDAIKTIGSVGKFAQNPNSTTAKEALYQLAPTGLKGMAERMFESKNGTQLDPNDPTKGLYKRNDFDKNARLLGFKSVPESKELQSASMAKMDEAHKLHIRTEALVKITDSFLAGDKNQMKTNMNTFLKNGGDPDALVNHLETVRMQQHMTRMQRQVGIPGGSVTSLERAKAAKEYTK